MSAALAGIIGVPRSASGDWLLGFAGMTTESSIVMRVLLSLLRGLQLAHHNDYLNLHVTIDSVEVITLLFNPIPIYSHIVNGCRSLLILLHDPLTQHTYRKFMADSLANFSASLTESDSTFWSQLPPLCASSPGMG